MYEAIGQALGATGGGLLGQVGSALSAPRRGLWSLLGGPEDGNQLVSDLTGLDKDGLLARALGVGAEIAFDPLTYSGMFLGGPMAKLWGRASGLESAAAGDVAGLTAAKAGAAGALSDRAALEAATLRQQLERVPNLAIQDVPGIAGGQVKPAALVHPAAIDELAASGMAQPRMGPMPAGSPSPVPGIDVLGRQLPPGFGSVPLQGGKGGRMVGSAVTRTGPGTLPTPGLSPEEVVMLQDLAAKRGGWESLENIHLPGPGKMEVLNDFATANAGRLNAARPMPTLGSALGERAGAVGPLSGLPLDQAPAALEQALREAAARQRSLDFGLADYLQVGAGAYGGGMAAPYLMGRETR